MIKLAQQIYKDRDQWIGGKLIEGNVFYGEKETRIIDIKLEDTGRSEYLHVIGEEFSCGCDLSTLTTCAKLDQHSYLLRSPFISFTVTYPSEN